jgi:hypothetical protein
MSGADSTAALPLLPQVLLLGGGLGAATLYAGCQLPEMHAHARQQDQQGQQGQQGRALGGCTSSALHLWHFSKELHLPTAAGPESHQGEAQQQQAPQAAQDYFSAAVQQLRQQAEVDAARDVGVVLLGALPLSGADQHGLLPRDELLQYMRQLAAAARLAQRAFPQVRPTLLLLLLLLLLAGTLLVHAGRGPAPACPRQAHLHFSCIMPPCTHALLIHNSTRILQQLLHDAAGAAPSSPCVSSSAHMLSHPLLLG